MFRIAKLHNIFRLPSPIDGSSQQPEFFWRSLSGRPLRPTPVGAPSSTGTIRIRNRGAKPSPVPTMAGVFSVTVAGWCLMTPNLASQALGKHHDDLGEFPVSAHGLTAAHRHRYSVAGLNSYR